MEATLTILIAISIIWLVVESLRALFLSLTRRVRRAVGVLRAVARALEFVLTLAALRLLVLL